MTQTEFDIKYGKRFPFTTRRVSDTRFLWILNASIVIVILAIVLLANMEFENLDKHIKKQYTEYVMGLTPAPRTPKQAKIIEKNRLGDTKNQDIGSRGNTERIKKSVPSINIEKIQIIELSHGGLGNDGDLAVRPMTRPKRGQVKIEMDGLLDNHIPRVGMI